MLSPQRPQGRVLGWVLSRGARAVGGAGHDVGPMTATARSDWANDGNGPKRFGAPRGGPRRGPGWGGRERREREAKNSESGGGTWLGRWRVCESSRSRDGAPGRSERW